MSVWDERYSGEEYFYGTEPNVFLVSQRALLESEGAVTQNQFLPPCRGKARMGVESMSCNTSTPSLTLPLQGGGDAEDVSNPNTRCLAVADGEGRNGVWLAQQGLDVLSVDASPVAQAKAQRLAQQRGVKMRFAQIDLMTWDGAGETFDVVVAIFIQFVGPAQRAQQFANLKRFLKPGGLLLLQGYTPRQLDYKTGGPSQVENLYTEAMLREAFADMDILHLAEHDDIIHEGAGHSGMSALVDLVARRASVNQIGVRGGANSSSASSKGVMNFS